MDKKTELSKDQKDLLKLLIACGANEDETIGIMLLTQRDYQTEAMIDYIIDNYQTKTVSDFMLKAIEISKMDKEKKEETETIVYLKMKDGTAMRTPLSKAELYLESDEALSEKEEEKGKPKILTENMTPDDNKSI